MKSDILPMYNPEEFFLSNPLNFHYLSQSFPNLNLFPSSSIHPYQQNSPVEETYISQLAKQMAYLRMLQEIENQRTTPKKSKESITSFDPSTILTESIHVNHIINDIMSKTLNEIFEQQIKQQKKSSRQGELLFVKKSNNDDIIISNTKKQHKVGEEN